MLRISEHTKKMINVELKSASGDVIDTFELAGISYHKWQELGLMVNAEVAPKIKDPNDPKKYIKDEKQQSANDADAEVLRNALRIVWCLENGGGIDWGDEEPATLLDKAEAFKLIDADTFTALLNALQVWVFGKRVSTHDAVQRFQ
jgi:hypothetical protein